MWILNTDNVCDYLAQHYPQFDQSGDVEVRWVGDPNDAPQEDESAGFVNHIFRVSTATSAILVKQGQENMRFNAEVHLPSSRNLQEYQTLQIRKVITPQYIPDLYYIDRENSVFLMQDVSYLGSVRYQLCAGKILPKLATQVGEYVAANSFYTSEFYMVPDEFRKLSAHFRNSEMRYIMENWVIMHRMNEPETYVGMDARGQYLQALTDSNPDVRARIFEMRHKFMCHAECFIHGDLHLSNMFGNHEELKIIDMEYTFAGPLCYDVGYFANTLIDQFCGANFRDFPSEQARMDFVQYTLTSLCQVYHSFVDNFRAHWQADAKAEYRNESSYCQLIIDSFLADILAYAAIPSLGQTHYMIMPEYNLLPESQRDHAQKLGNIISHHFLLQGKQYCQVEQAAAAMVQLAQAYREKM